MNETDYFMHRRSPEAEASAIAEASPSQVYSGEGATLQRRW